MAPPGRRRFAPSMTTLLLGLLLLFTSIASAATTVLGVDLGTEYIKAALVKPGIPLEIVLTKDSKRKEAAAVAFKPLKSGTDKDVYPERAYGGDAVALSARFPGDVYPNIKPLLGVPFNDTPAVLEYAKRHPAIELVEQEGRPTVAFKSKAFADEAQVFAVEELLAMQLLNIRENAKALAGKGSEVSAVVFTVPPFYTADEKRALEVAANLAGMTVLGMVTDGVAVGMNYATSRTFEDITVEGNKPEYHLVFDMGAGSTTATVLRFQGRTVKDTGRYNKTVQEVTVLGAGWDRSLGGDALNGIIVDDMVAQFVDSKAAKSAGIKAEDVFTHGRAANKLWKDAEKLRQVLSANQETGASFESLYEDTDFKYRLSRTQFESMTTEFAARIDGPIAQALGSAGLSWSDMNSVIVHGGASRTPFVQKRLEELAGDASKIRASVNADEAAVFGAAFKAASISPSFRVKEIRDTDTIGYPVGVQYTWNLKDRLQNLFNPTTKAGVVKEIPFKMMGEFDFTLYQTVPSGKEEPARSPIVHAQTGNMTKVITNLIDDEGCDRESIDTKFTVRINPVNGLPEVIKGWAQCEVEEKKEGVMDSVKGLFGFGSKKDGQEPLKEGEAEEITETVDTQSASSSSSSANAGSSEASTDKTEAEAAKDAKPKKKTVKSAVTFHLTQKGYEKHPRKETTRMSDRLKAFDKSDKARRAREELHNSLEAFTYRARDYLEDSSFIESSTAEVRSKLEEALAATSEWLYEEGSDATADVLQERLKSLHDLVDPVIKRRDEAKGRPEKVKALQDALDQTKSLAELMKEQIKVAAEESSKSEIEASSSSASASSAAEASASETPSASDPLADLEEDVTSSSASTTATPKPAYSPPPYTPEDLETISKASSEAQEWLDAKLTEQDKLQAHEDAAFSIAEIEEYTQKVSQAMMVVIQRKIRQQPYSSYGGGGSGGGKKEKKKEKAKSKSKASKSKKGKSKTKSAEAEVESETPKVKVEHQQELSEEEMLRLVEEAAAKEEAAKGKKTRPTQKDEL